jgi:hypothetical protein
MQNESLAPFASVVLKLLQNYVCSDEPEYWKAMLTYQAQIQEFFTPIALQVIISEEDGYAFIHQPLWEDDWGHPLPLPRLTRLSPIAREATCLGVLLREQLMKFEMQHPEKGDLLLTKEEIHALLLPYLPKRMNEFVAQRQTKRAISTLVDLGFLKSVAELGESEFFQVRRILKAKITAEKCMEMLEKMKAARERYDGPELDESVDDEEL